MALTPVSLVGEESPELGSEAAEDHNSDSEYTDVSMNFPSQGGAFIEGDYWPSMTDAYLNNDFSDSTGPFPRAFETGRSKLSSDWLQILQEGNKRYPLRDTTRHTFRGSGFHDFDKSGDWDPNAESDTSSRPRKPRHRKRLIAKDLKDNDDNDGVGEKQNTRSRTLSYEQGRKNGRSMHLELQIFSEQGKEKFRALTNEHLKSEGFADEVAEGDYTKNFGHLATGSPELSLMGQTGVNARRSAAKDSDMGIEHPYQNKEAIYENLLGHREARGCRDCYDIGMECSLIDNGQSYPCQTCKEDDQDCILIIPSKEKRPCEQCTRKKLHCSYTDDQGKGIIAACHNCQISNVLCLAGPAKSSRIDDVLSSVDKTTNSKAASKAQDWTKKPSMKFSNVVKKPVARLKKPHAKSLAKGRRSLKSNKSSSKRGRRNVTQKIPSGKLRSRKLSSKSDSNLEDSEKSSVPGAKVMHITTSFCHPIHFNWIPPPTLPPLLSTSSKPASETKASSYPCHFCTDPGLPYALAGLGIRRVEVMLWEYDVTAGYEELDNGWSKAGEECTRMCVHCTMERVLICLCTDHIIRPIPGLDPRTFDFDGAISGVLNQNLNRGKEEQGSTVDVREHRTDVKWCSICVDPAFFECCVTPPFTSSGRETSPSDDIGCGLLLCEVCALKMSGRYKHQQNRGSDIQVAELTPPASSDSGSAKQQSEERFKAIMTLDQHINAASLDYFQYPDGLRADVCFLKSDGELMRRQGAEDTFAADGDELDFMAEDQDFNFGEFDSQPLEERNCGMEDLIDLT